MRLKNIIVIDADYPNSTFYDLWMCINKIQCMHAQWKHATKMWWGGLKSTNSTNVGTVKRRYDVRHEMLTQRNPFCHHARARRVSIS